ncbi:hypothetical protein LEMLEM_LOCUS18157, partial [Lemmus lemmus]
GKGEREEPALPERLRKTDEQNESRHTVVKDASRQMLKNKEWDRRISSSKPA